MKNKACVGLGSVAMDIDGSFLKNGKKQPITLATKNDNCKCLAMLVGKYKY